MMGYSCGSCCSIVVVVAVVVVVVVAAVVVVVVAAVVVVAVVVVTLVVDASTVRVRATPPLQLLHECQQVVRRCVPLLTLTCIRVCTNSVPPISVAHLLPQLLRDQFSDYAKILLPSLCKLKRVTKKVSMGNHFCHH